MTPRVLTLYLGLGCLLLIAAIVAAFAWTESHAKKPSHIEPKNNMVFNWGSSS
jgi:hypothetical protein